MTTRSHRWFRCFVALLSAALFSLPSAAAQSIDRMLAIVDSQVITYGDLVQFRYLAEVFAFADQVPESDDEALAMLIEERLIRAQVRQFPVIRVTDAEVDARVDSLPVEDAVPFVGSELIRQTARDRLERAQYFDIRFRQFVTASDDEVADYYESVFVPEAIERGMDPIPPLADVAEGIRRNVVVEQTDRDIAEWIESLERRSEIEIVD